MTTYLHCINLQNQFNMEYLYLRSITYKSCNLSIKGRILLHNWVKSFLMEYSYLLLHQHFHNIFVIKYFSSMTSFYTSCFVKTQWHENKNASSKSISPQCKCALECEHNSSFEFKLQEDRPVRSKLFQTQQLIVLSLLNDLI